MSERKQTQQSKKPDSTFQKQTTSVNQNSVSHPASIIQRARINPKSLTAADVLQLQCTIGNRAVGRLLSEIGAIPSKAKQAPPVQRQELIQRQEIPEEEEPLQGKFIESVQRQEIPEEEEPLQGKFENKPEIATCPSCVADPIMQMQEIPEEEEPLQGKFETIQRLEPEDEEKLQMKSVVQRQEIPEEEEPLQTKRENNTGMPDNLKAGVESLSGIDMSDVRVHYNSSEPAKVGALAYAQGTNIHVAPAQEKYLPHEAWHVVQQAQERVKPTIQLKDVVVNDDVGLEMEADVMGEKSSKLKIFNVSPKRNEFDLGLKTNPISIQKELIGSLQNTGSNVVQRMRVGDPGASAMQIAAQKFPSEVFDTARVVLDEMKAAGTNFDSIEDIVAAVKRDPRVAPLLKRVTREAQYIEQQQRQRDTSQPLCTIQIGRYSSVEIKEFDITNGTWAPIPLRTNGDHELKTTIGDITFSFHVHPPDFHGRLPIPGEIMINEQSSGMQTSRQIIDYIARVKRLPQGW